MKSKLFVVLAFAGFAGAFFLTGALSADSISVHQLIHLGFISAAMMGIGVIGYMLSAPVHIN